MQFRRHFDDWEIEDVNLLPQKLSSVVIIEEREDSVQWTASRDEKFSVISCYKMLQVQGDIVDEQWPAKII